MTVIYALLFISILIFVHELGHFLTARVSGIKVKKFSIGFGPAIFKVRRKDTEYAISLLPLGGYVRLLGELPEERDMENSFFSKSPVTRAIVGFSGSLFNFLTAFLFYTVLNFSGYEVLMPVVGEVMKGYPAEKVGIKPGDVIEEINGEKIEVWEDIFKIVNRYGEKELTINIRREGKKLSLHVTPVKEGTEHGERFLIGIKPSMEKTKKIKPGIFKSVYLGAEDTLRTAGLTIYGIWNLATGKLPLSELKGPVFIMKTAGEAGKAGWRKFFFLLAVISVNLALVNLLPIPALDGGLLLISLVEIITGRETPYKVREIIQTVGIFLLIILFTLILYNDIIHAILNK